MDTATKQSIPVCQDQPLKQQATHRVEGGAQIFHFLCENRISHCGTGYQFRNFRHQNECKFRVQNYLIQSNGTAVPLRAWTGPAGS